MNEYKSVRNFVSLCVLCLIIGYTLGFLRRLETDSPMHLPSEVEVVSIYDGDTIFVDIDGWPEIIGRRIGIRIRGIDTPEMRDNRKHIKELAQEAKMFVVEQVRYSKVELRNIERDKYFRIVADVYVDGKNLADLLLEKGLAKKYDGGTKVKWK